MHMHKACRNGALLLPILDNTKNWPQIQLMFSQKPTSANFGGLAERLNSPALPYNRPAIRLTASAKIVV
jgi:hypothetical protein